MLEKLGTRKTLGTMCVVNLITCGVVSWFAQPPRKFEKRNDRRIPWKFFRDPIFVLTIFVHILNTLTINIPNGFGPDFSKALGFGAGTGAILLAANSGIGSLSRIGIGHIADKIGHQNTLSLGMMLTALATWILWLIGAKTEAKWMWYIFIIIHGLAGGAFSTLYSNVNIQVFGHEVYFTVTGVFSSARGVGYIAGVPLAGLIIGKVKDRATVPDEFTGMITYTGVLLLVGTLCMLAIRILDGRRKGWKWIS